MTRKQVVVIGSGFSGLSAASHLALDQASSCSVLLLEKNDSPGGRARQFSAQGFYFDMGPSWYWMPNVFESYFSRFGKCASDYYDLVRLDPSYAVIFGENDVLEVPADLGQLKELFESLEPGSSARLDAFLAQAKRKYELGITDLVNKPSLSLLEFVSPTLLANCFRLDLFKSMSQHLLDHFSHERILRLLGFPVLFLGETADNIPALYSLMNYADLVLGTWYPMGGMYKIIQGMVHLAQELGVKIRYSAEVAAIEVQDGWAHSVRLTSGEVIKADIVVAGADYHHIDRNLLDPSHSNYSDEYWDRRLLAPSCLIFFLGINGRLKNLRHHNLFFDEALNPHADAIFKTPSWPEKPLFYVSVPSITDPSVAPPGMENLFVLIPLAPGLTDSEDMRDKYYNLVMHRMERLTHQDIRSKVIYKRSYAHKDFEADYHAFKGNAYGLANTLLQTAIFKPCLKNYNVSNLYYTGQLTVPGPGVPPCLISGRVVATQVAKDHFPTDH